MKEPSDSDVRSTVVSMSEFRNKRTKKLFEDADVLDNLPTMIDWVGALKDMLDDPTKFEDYNSTWTDPGDPDLSCDDRDASVSDEDVERLYTILGVVDDALQSLYHAHATITSDKLWTRAEAIQKQIAAMVAWAEQQRKLREE